MPEVTTGTAKAASPGTSASGHAVPGNAVPDHAELQRRERKKRQTRDALVHAALTLFDAKGYDHTAVREITDAVDVSERTFFRYFASKEDLALSFIRETNDMFVRELVARPPEEPPFVALANAFRAAMPALLAAGPPGEEPMYLLVIKLIDTTPSLLAVLGFMHELNRETIRVLAAREGVDPDTDRRPRLATAAYGALVIAANREWLAGDDDSAEALLAAFDACAGQFVPALAGHWT